MVAESDVEMTAGPTVARPGLEPQMGAGIVSRVSVGYLRAYVGAEPPEAVIVAVLGGDVEREGQLLGRESTAEVTANQEVSAREPGDVEPEVDGVLEGAAIEERGSENRGALALDLENGSHAELRATGIVEPGEPGFDQAAALEERGRLTDGPSKTVFEDQVDGEESDSRHP